MDVCMCGRVRKKTMLAFLLVLLLTGANSLKNVRLEMSPEVVEHGREVLLQCHYDLEDVDLYSLKWYRGSYEFYRYSPGENPDIKIFNFNWIDVDPKKSDKNYVTIRNVDYKLTGNFSCEVTTDAPNFTTASSSKALTVVSFPKSKPVIRTERSRYEPGETLKAKCSTSFSRPPVELFFTLNDHEKKELSTTRVVTDRLDSNAVPQNPGSSSRVENSQEYWLSEISLFLQPYHFVEGHLSLKCNARVPGTDYYEWSRVQLGANQKEPIPARVTSNNTCTNCHRISDLTIVSMIVLHFHWR